MDGDNELKVDFLFYYLYMLFHSDLYVYYICSFSNTVLEICFVIFDAIYISLLHNRVKYF